MSAPMFWYCENEKRKKEEKKTSEKFGNYCSENFCVVVDELHGKVIFGIDLNNNMSTTFLTHSQWINQCLFFYSTNQVLYDTLYY